MNKNHDHHLKSSTNSLLIFRPWDSSSDDSTTNTNNNNNNNNNKLNIGAVTVHEESNLKNKIISSSSPSCSLSLSSSSSSLDHLKNNQMIKGQFRSDLPMIPMRLPKNLSEAPLNLPRHQELYSLFHSSPHSTAFTPSIKNLTMFSTSSFQNNYPFSEYFLERCFHSNVRSINPLNFPPNFFTNYIPNVPNATTNLNNNLMIPSSKTVGVDFDPINKMIQQDNHHKQPSTGSTTSTSNNKKQRPKRFQCPHCQVSFSNNGQLKGHIRIHTGERPFICDHQNCGKTFTRNEELTRHKRIHTGLRPFACSICNKRFGRKDHLKKHVKTHQRPPPMPITLSSTLAAYPPFSYPWI